MKLSRAIDTSQQAVSKHLETMERHGMVISRTSKSERGGPPTKTYSLNREVSIRIDIGPCLFQTDVEEFDAKRVDGYEDVEEDIERADSLEDYRKLILEINKKIQRLEEKRIYLLKLKERALVKASERVMNKFDDYRERNLLYHVLNAGDTDYRSIAKKLGYREDEVLRLINNMKEKTNIW